MRADSSGPPSHGGFSAVRSGQQKTYSCGHFRGPNSGQDNMNIVKKRRGRFETLFYGPKTNCNYKPTSVPGAARAPRGQPQYAPQ